LAIYIILSDRKLKEEKPDSPGRTLGECFILSALWVWPTLSGINRDRRGLSKSKQKRQIMESCATSIPDLPKLIILNYASLKRGL